MTVLVSDSFNRANSTTTLGTTDSYNGGTAKTWTVDNSGTWGISSNQAYNAGSTSTAYISSGVSDGFVSIKFTVLSNYDAIIFRYTNTTNFWKVNNESGDYKLQKYVNGSNGIYTVVADSGVAPASGDVVKVKLSGSSITVYVNGNQIMSATDSFNQTATIHGIRASSSSSRFDNFEIDDLNTGQTTTYVGGGSITAVSSLTSASHIVLSDGKAFNGNSSLTGAEIFSYAANGSLSGQSNLSSNEYMTYLASGTLQSVSSLVSSDAFIGASGTRYSGMGNILSFSSLSSSEIEKYSGVWSISAFASLTGNSFLVIKEKGDIQAVSIPGNTIVNTTFNVHGDINTVSFLSSGDLLNGMKNPQQYQDDGIILMHTGLLSHEELIHFAFPLYHGEEIHIQGLRKMNVYLVGEQVNQVSFNGRQVTTIYLKGVRK